MNKRTNKKSKNVINIATIIIVVTVLFLLGLCAVSVSAAEPDKEYWKTAITPEECVLDDVFEYYEEAQTFYTTTRLNMRTYPNTDSKENIKKVLSRNAEVTAIAEYNGWTKIVAYDEKYVEQFYYVWGEYLSEEKTTVTPAASNTYLGKFTLTAYCNCGSCCGKWAGGPTASGTYPVEGRTVAMGGVPFGTKLLINGKVYTVEDRGTPYGHVDIYFDNHDECNEFGRRTADVYRIN